MPADAERCAVYGGPGLPLAFVALPLDVVLPNHCATVFGVPLATLGARLLDALADPWLGRWADAWFAHSPRRVLAVAARLDLRGYFNGPLTAHGIFSDRSGKVVRRFSVKMTGTWNRNQGVLDEDFTCSDGKKERRVWRLTDFGDDRYSGRADDVVGEAVGQAAGNALNWRYTLALPVDGRVWEVQFDDWMVLMDERVMLNKAVMSKFGIRLGEVTLSFSKP